MRILQLMYVSTFFASVYPDKAADPTYGFLVRILMVLWLGSGDGMSQTRTVRKAGRNWAGSIEVRLVA